MDKLERDFVDSITRMSFYNAGEGESYWSERDAAADEYARLMQLKAEMLRVYGRAYTVDVINRTPHLCYSELNLPEEVQS